MEQQLLHLARKMEQQLQLSKSQQNPVQLVITRVGLD
jgi:hypothetical protein